MSLSYESIADAPGIFTSDQYSCHWYIIGEDKEKGKEAVANLALSFCVGYGLKAKHPLNMPGSCKGLVLLPGHSHWYAFNVAVFLRP